MELMRAKDSDRMSEEGREGLGERGGDKGRKGKRRETVRKKENDRKREG